MNAQELRDIPVLQSMDGDALDQLAAALEAREYGNAEAVFAEGDPGDSMYFIAQGRIRIEKRVHPGEGLHKTLTVLEPGDYFGEMALLDQKPRSASAVASGDAKLLRLSKSAFDKIQAGSGAVGVSVLFAMIRTSSERIRRLSSHLVVYDEVGKAIGEAKDLQTLLHVILHQLVSAVSADWALLILRSQFSDRFDVRVQTNLELTAAQREAIGNGRGFIGAALPGIEEMLVGNFSEDAVVKSYERLGFETPSLLLSPITVDRQLLGAIVLGGNHVAQFDLDGLNLARGIARQAAQAILNARHREEEQARSRHARQFVRF